MFPQLVLVFKVEPGFCIPQSQHPAIDPVLHHPMAIKAT